MFEKIHLSFRTILNIALATMLIIIFATALIPFFITTSISEYEKEIMLELDELMKAIDIFEIMELAGHYFDNTTQDTRINNEAINFMDKGLTQAENYLHLMIDENDPQENEQIKRIEKVVKKIKQIKILYYNYLEEIEFDLTCDNVDIIRAESKLISSEIKYMLHDVLAEVNHDIILAMKNYDIIYSKSKKQSILCIFFGIICSFLLSYFMAKALTTPIRELYKGTKKISKGNFNYILKHKSNDELGKLANAFNEMAKSLMISQEKLVKAKVASETATKAKSDFLANMSHEIRTPLNGIIGMASLGLTMDLTPKLRKYLNTISSSGQLLLKLINDILDLSKIESQKLTMESTVLNVNSIIDSVLDLFIENAAKKNIKLLSDISNEVPDKLLGDPLRLNQILINIIGNALKFTHSGEIIISTKPISTKKDKILLAFSVQDSGIGIEKKYIEKIFEPFEQTDSSMTRNYGGTGLGLTICKNLIEMMNGKFWVDSTINQGTTFHFTAEFGLQTEELNAKFIIHDEMEGHKILFFGTNPVTKATMKAKLEAFTFKMVSASTSEETITILKDSIAKGAPFQLVIMDWELNGPDIVTEWEEMNKKFDIKTQTKSVIVTSLKRNSDIERIVSADIDSYLIKPIKDSLLFNTIIELLGNSSDGQDSCLNYEDLNTSIGNENNYCKILLVEDNKLNQLVAVELLKKIGIENITIANNGFEAIEAVNDINDLDIIFMDLQMPEMDGIEATKQIIKHEKFNNIPIIALTANTMKDDLEKCLSAGMDDHMSKPIDLVKIIKIIKKWSNKSKKTSSLKVQTNKENSTTNKNLTLPSSLPGINLNTVYSNYGDDLRFYAKLLKSFAADYANICNDIREAIKQSDQQTAGSLAHSLKGLAGHLSATNLHNALVVFNKDLKNKNLTNIDLRINDVENLLNEVVKTAGKIIIEPEDKIDSMQTDNNDNFELSKEEITLLSEFAILLKHNDLKAETYFDDLKKMPIFLGESKLKEIQEHINNYRYKEALSNFVNLTATKGLNLEEMGTNI